MDRRDWLVLVSSGLIFCISFVFFFWESSQFSESGREVVGTVVYRNRVAQKRNSSSNLWENVEQNEEVRNLDLIRTDEKAEAIITLTSGTQIEMDPFSMIVLNIKGSDVEIKLERGSMVVKPASGDSVRIHKDIRTVLGFDSMLRVYSDINDAWLVFSEGSFQVEKGEESQIARGGDSIQVNEEKIISYPVRIRPITPPDNLRLFTSKEKPILQKFSWEDRSESGRENSLYRLELSGDPFFTKVQSSFVSKTNSLEIPLRTGNYYWRILSDADRSVPRRIRVRDRDQIMLKDPVRSQVIGVDVENLVSFLWTEAETAVRYEVRVSKDREFQKDLIQRTTGRVGLSIPLGPGKYFWKVAGTGGVPGSDLESEVSEFEVVANEYPDYSKLTGSVETGEETVVESEEKKDNENLNPQSMNPKLDAKERQVPTIRVQKPQNLVDMTGKDQLIFEWEPIPEVTEYELFLFQNTGNETLVLKRKVKGGKFVLKDLSVLDIGNFSWYLIGDWEDGRKIYSPKTKFRIILSENLKAPILDLR
jgi:hypothetical protein